MNVLLNYEEIPESNKVYLIDFYDDDLVKVQSLHGKYINCTEMSDEEEANADWLADRLLNETPIFDSTDIHSFPSIFHAEIYIQTGFLI